MKGNNMTDFDYDFVVIGGGPAGRRAAIQASKLGKSVAIVDDQKKSRGVSVHTGTLPSKNTRESDLSVNGWRDQQFTLRRQRHQVDVIRQYNRSRHSNPFG